MKVIFYYTDGTVVEREFDTSSEAYAFAVSEGDHLHYYEIVRDD